MNSHQHTNRKDLAGEHIYGDLGQIIFLIAFLTTWIFDSFLFKYSIHLNRLFSIWFRIPAGSFILVISGIIAWKGLNMVFGEEQKKPTVITEGVFSLVRHPIYLSAILLYFSMIIYSISLLSICVWLIIIGFYHFLGRYEEKLLMRKFGDKYNEYMKDVPMWIPKIFRNR